MSDIYQQIYSIGFKRLSGSSNINKINIKKSKAFQDPCIAENDISLKRHKISEQTSPIIAEQYSQDISKEEDNSYYEYNDQESCQSSSGLNVEVNNQISKKQQELKLSSLSIEKRLNIQSLRNSFLLEKLELMKSHMVKKVCSQDLVKIQKNLISVALQSLKNLFQQNKDEKNIDLVNKFFVLLQQIRLIN